MTRPHSIHSLLAATTALSSFVGFAAPAVAQDEPAATGDTIVVTGSRIRRAVGDTPAPFATIGEQDFSDRGYISAADALNQSPSFSPQLNQAPGSGDSAGSGQQFPDLFGIGPGRTLTLVNGRRFVTSSSGLEEPQVDANIIPTGLIDRVEILQAGGAAVYGSDAIAGVVNYILKDNFEGLELDAQTGFSDDGDLWQHKIRGTAGLNFADGRGNIAANVEWSKTPEINYNDNDLYAFRINRISQPNPDNTGPDDGIPDDIELFDRTFYPFNSTGIVWGQAFIPPCFAGPQPAPLPFCLTTAGGTNVQFSEDGQSLVPYDIGEFVTIPFSSGGDGTPYSDLVGFRTGVERWTGNVIGHYDLTDNVRVYTELMYARTEGTELGQGFPRSVLTPVGTGQEAIRFTNLNPFLSAEAIATLNASNSSFAMGGPLFLSKNFYTPGDLFDDTSTRNLTETYRGLLGVEGEFVAGERDFYWSVMGSFARVEGQSSSLSVLRDNFNNAVNAVSDGMGGAVCAINADMDASNDDPNCVAYNPFGIGNASQAAKDYVISPSGQDYVNEQIDFLATIGTTLFTLPTGGVETVLTYEHRDETASFTPFLPNQTGVLVGGQPTDPTSGGYNTDEFGAELLVPIVGGDFTLPFAELIELSGSYRFVDNSLAGSESVWSANGRWVVAEDLTFRATRSRNFRAPTLTQVLAPTTTTLTNIGGADPCDFRYIDEGPNPAVRRANCEAEWAMNPGYEPLPTYQNPSTNFTTAQITSGGNPDLDNEVSDTWTFGAVFTPRFVPGLTFSVDRIQIDLTDALVSFTTADFAAVCYDSSPQPAEFCNEFERLPAMMGTDPGGSIISGRTTTVNAGSVVFRGEVYYLSYDFPMEDIFSSGDPGDFTISVQATHTAKKTTSVTGFDFSRTDNTLEDPDWVGRLNANYSRGPLRLSYQAYYLDSVKASENANSDNSLYPVIDTNITHSISAQFDILENVTLRAGINNFTNKYPSYPTLTHGDALGRRFFFGVNARI